MSRDKNHKFKEATWIKNMLLKGPVKRITLLENSRAFKKKIVTLDPSSVSRMRKMPKFITSYADCLEFLRYLERTCSEDMPRRRLAVMYLVIWLSEVIFPIASKEVRSSCIYPTCKMAFGATFSLAPALVSYLYMRLKMIGFSCAMCQAIQQVLW